MKQPTPGPGGGSAAVRPRLEVSGTQVVAGALASVSAAGVASAFGTAGTITGTAVGSVVTTLGGAVYGAGLHRTTSRLRQTGADGVPLPPIRPAPPRTRLDRGRRWLRERRWGVVTGFALVLVLALGLVTLIELAGQRPLSAIAHRDPSGTTSIGEIVRDDAGDGPDDRSPQGTGSSTTASTTTITTPGTGGGTGNGDGQDGEAPTSTETTSSTATPETGTGETPTTGTTPPGTTGQPAPAAGG